ncbi:hypothetical protein [Rhizobium lentis]|uniref:hypothetical protein n=1 Tax=Rhizobium lentis TaxID=1138194 RepID=UPI001A91FC48|nr:hypothetical protein [Rhizobium lentis]MBX5066367.1 hypothetical protein [Rhizobium lentis]MBX5077435.1 hypothetical protein [Rhizobium lentis]QSW91809.1 hypothetical protein J0663_11805 [Rhizobium lentis]
MTPRLPRDIPSIRRRAKLPPTPAARPYFPIVVTAMINFGLCALVLMLIGGTSTQYAVLSALSLPACLAAMAARRWRARERRRVTAGYLLSYTAAALTMLQWCYIAIVTLGSFSSSQSVILRSIG